ncbi:HisA/HisF-related TIM barrel protein [Blastopirellula sp. J2-11]|uniref:HisA/HisF-related TIM barrel protein n=1 Tax=Blastopirellula sp. J2-11 TaxID=2943192 RepID=UPI0021C9A262|nr:HisA/HisF-related TIM barrel protein [Blastopirellula sp. J2-11]UUO07905.1 HisA/HisF-related TIM barrel protein [Blastopirellula sp. J2-11]
MTSRSELPAAILPVIDLKDRHVVRGVGGLRHRYRPIESRLCASSEPGDIAAAMVAAYSFRDAYVADLDAILDGRPQVEDWRKIAQAGLRLHLDAGLATLADCQRVIEALEPESVASLIVGLETLQRWEDLGQITAEFGESVTFSLDLRHGRPLRIVGAAIRPEEIAQRAFDCGARRMVLLDLAHVGQGRGTGTEMLCRELSTQLTGVEWVTGGGIRTLADIETQVSLGAARVLVSSALHEDEKILMARPQ